nr:MAG TPA: PGDYG protein [Caudoviricetes sp.]
MIIDGINFKELNITKDDMLITVVNGEIYPCKKEIFEKTYEKCIEKSIV